MTEIGEVSVRIKADSAQFQHELKSATDTVKESAGEMSDAFEVVRGALEAFGIALGAAEVVEFAKGALEAADSLYILSQRTGLSIDTLSGLNVPLKQNGSSVDELASMMKFLSRNIELAAEGNTELLKRFDDLHLSVTKLLAMTPDEQLKAWAEAMGKVTDQSKFMADGMALGGRGFAAFGAIIRATHGDIQQAVKDQEELGNTVSPEEVARIHAADDAWIEFWEHMKVKAVEAAIALRDFAAAHRQMRNEDTLSGVGGRGSTGKGSVSTDRPATVDLATFMGRDADYPAAQYDPTFKPSATGKNDDIRALTADTKDAAEQLGPYIDKLNEEAAASETSQKALFVKRTELEAITKAQTDYTNGLRETQDLTDDEKAKVDAAAAALFDHKEALAQNKQVADQLSNALSRIVLNFKDMKSAVSDLFQAVAQQIIKTQIATPLSNSIQGILGGGSSSGLFSGFTHLLGFAAGGSPPVGVPSIVGENGPELFVPSQAGTVVPNSKLGGTRVVVQQTFNMQPGLPETVGVAIRQSAPQIAAMAHASIIQAIQSGGAESRIVGRRS